MEVASAVQVLDVLKRPGGEVVEGVDLPAVVEEAFAEMGADEPGPARDERFSAHAGKTTRRAPVSGRGTRRGRCPATVAALAVLKPRRREPVRGRVLP